MNFKTSLFSKSIFLNSIKRYGWIGILYFIILLFNIPLRIIITFSNYKYQIVQGHVHSIEEIFAFQSLHVLLPHLIIPVFIGIYLFRYIKTKKISELIQDLPIRRESIFITNILVGLLLIILPILLISIISTIMLASIGLFNLWNIVLDWLIGTIAFSIIFFSVSVLSGNITGISTWILPYTLLFLSYLLLLLPCVLSGLILFNLNNLMYGFNYNYINYLKINFFKLSPITRILEFILEPSDVFTIQEFIIYLIVSVIVIMISYYLYKLRKTESGEQPITFNILKPIFKYSLTLSGMLLVGLYFNNKNSFLWMIVGHIIGSLLGYFLSEMIIRKTFYVFKNIKGYLIYAIIIVMILVSISTSENYIPKKEDVEAVSFDISNSNKLNYFGEYDHSVSLRSEENLEKVRNIHEKVIKNKKEYRYYDGLTNYLYLGYKFKNGKHIYREYKVPNEMFTEYAKPILESIEFKKSRYDIFKYEASEINKFIFEFYYKSIDKYITVKNENYFAELKDIIENEIINMKYEDMYNSGYNKDDIDIFIVPEDDRDNINMLIDPENEIENRRYYLDKKVITLPKESRERIVKWLFDNDYKVNSY